MRISFVLFSFLVCFPICAQNDMRTDFQELKSTLSKEQLEEVEKRASDPDFQKKMKKEVDLLMSEMKEVEEILNSTELSLHEKVDSSLNIINRGYQRNPWNAEKYAHSVYLFSRKHKMLDAQARSAEMLGLTQDMLGKKESDTSYQLALQLYSDLGIKDKQIRCLTYLIGNASEQSDERKFRRYTKMVYSMVNGRDGHKNISNRTMHLFHQNMGESYSELGQLDSAIYHFELALRMAENLGLERVALAYLNLGNVYNQKDDFVKAFENWLSCKKIGERIGDTKLQARVSMSMGNAYSSLRDYESAIASYEEAYHLVQSSDDLQLQILSLVSWSRGLFYKGSFTKALSVAKLAEILAWTGISAGLKYEIYLVKGAAYTNLGEFQNAEEMFEQAEASMSKSVNQIRSAALYMNMGYLRFIQKKYRDALSFFERTRQLEMQYESYDYRVDASRYMYEIYSTLGNASKAMEMADNYLTERSILDSLDARSKVIALELNTNFQLQQQKDSLDFANQFAIQSAESRAKDESLKRKESELEVKRNQQYLLFGGIGFLALFLLFLYNRYRVTNRQNKIIEEQKDKNLFLSQKILEQDQQLILGETAKTVAHELNSPLGAIKAGAEGLHYLMDELVKNLLPSSSKEELDVASRLSEQQDQDSFIGLKQKREKVEAIQKKLKKQYGVEGSSSKEIASELSELQIYDPDEQIIRFLTGCQDRQPIYRLAKCIGQIKMISQTTISATNKSAEVVSSVRDALNFQNAEDRKDILLKESIDSVITIIEANINEKGSFTSAIDEEIYLRRVNEFKIFQLWYNLIVFLVEESNAPMEIHLSAEENTGFIELTFRLNQLIVNQTLNEHHYNIIMNAKKDSNDLRMGIVKYLLSENELELKSNNQDDATSFVIAFPC